MAELRSPAREDLCRSAPFTLTRATEVDDGLTIEGYGAVFNSVTRISGWEGDFEEVIAPGAFKKSLRERVPRMQFDHGQHPLLGSLPLGRWTVAEEDERGLHLVGRLTDNWLVTPFRDAIRDGGVEGMSFRFAVVRDEWADATGTRLKDDEIAHYLHRGAGDRGPIRRTLREVKASEAGPVVWPAYDDTAVGVRSRFGVTDLRDQRVTIDLGRLHQPGTQRQLADLVAFTDRLTGTQPGTRSVDDPDTPQPVEATPPPEVPAGSPNVEQQIVIENNNIEPQPTAPAADPHPTTDPVAAPEVTDRAAGEHSATTARPVNPVERRELIRKEFRAVTNRVLALPRNQNPKENSA
jgi:HK97 family phage prohead protease